MDNFQRPVFPAYNTKIEQELYMAKSNRRAFIQQAAQCAAAAAAWAPGAALVERIPAASGNLPEHSNLSPESPAIHQSLSRMKSWLMDTNCIPQKTPQLAKQIEAVQSWAKAAFMQEPRDVHQEKDAITAFGCKLPVATPPFSFQYGGSGLHSRLAGWRRKLLRHIGPGWTRYEISYTDPATQLEIVCDLKIFNDFPAIHWELRFTNHGATDTPLLENILPLDMNAALPQTGDVVLNHDTGSSSGDGMPSGNSTDFLPKSQVVGANANIRFAPSQGRSSDDTLPFFNLNWKQKGMSLAIGWTGQWCMSLATDEEKKARVQAGQQQTHLKLLPGESIRTPSITLLLWSGQAASSGDNLMRRLLLTHFAARIDGKIAVPPVSMWQISTAGSLQTLNDVTQRNQITAIDTIARRCPGVEVFWLDAGWFEGGWQHGVGNWFPNNKTFPNGLKPVADAAHRHGLSFLLWFEPERVWPGTQIDREHPDWLLHDAPWGAQGLFNLGNPQARQWMTNLLIDRIREWNIDILRQDFNIAPLGFWRGADAPDRQGITENHYIEGLYMMWDDLRRTFPTLAIDCCASGGRRIDLESLKRCFYLWRSDVMSYGQAHAIWNQTECAGLNQYVPTNSGGTGDNTVSAYDFRSTATTGVTLYMPDSAKHGTQTRQAIAELKLLRPLYLGDFYPLSDTNLKNNTWAAWQFDRPEIGRGFAVFFRRPGSTQAKVNLPLQALDAGSRYHVTLRDSEYRISGTQILTGVALRAYAAQVHDAPGTLLLVYRRLPS